MRGNPAITGQAAGVVINHDDQRVLLLTRIAEDADDLVAVAVGVGVQVALGGFDRADMLGPAGPGHSLVHQRQRGLLGLGGLTRGAQARDARKQCQRRRAALPGRVAHQAFADQLFHVAPPPGAPDAAAGLLPPPGT